MPVEETPVDEIPVDEIPVEQIKGEYRPAKPGNLNVSRRKLGYVLLILIAVVVVVVVVVVVAYLVVNPRESIQGVFSEAKQAQPSVELIAGDTTLRPDIMGSIETHSNQNVQQLVPIKPAEPVVDQAVIVNLPALEKSDDLFRKQWSELWAKNNLGSWAEAEQLVRKMTAIIDNLAQGKIVRNLLGGFTLKSPFLVELVLPVNDEEGSVDVYRLSPANYPRYLPLVTSVTALNTDQLVSFYLHLRPLFKQAYSEFGYSDADVDSIFIKTLERIQAVPIRDGEVLLIRPQVMYQFQDETLEQRSALEKQLLRMGPANMQALQQKARELEVALSSALLAIPSQINQ